MSKMFFTSGDIARMCGCDLKTVHNWVRRGELHHFKTPGRHMRFKQHDVFDFLRRFGFPVSEKFGEENER